MSNVETPPTEAPAPQTPQDWQAMYEAEAIKTRDLIDQRNRLKPAQQMLNNLNDADRAAFIRAGELRGLGDDAGLADWMEASLEGITGMSVADLIAQRQKEAQREPDERPTPGLTQEQVDQQIEQRLAFERDRQRGEANVSAEMSKIGYTLNSASGQTIINHAVRENISLTEAAAWYESDVTGSVLEKQKAAAAAAASVPGASPNGSLAGTAPDYDPKLSPQENRAISIRAKLENRATR